MARFITSNTEITKLDVHIPINLNVNNYKTSVELVLIHIFIMETITRRSKFLFGPQYTLSNKLVIIDYR